MCLWTHLGSVTTSIDRETSFEDSAAEVAEVRQVTTSIDRETSFEIRRFFHI